MNLMMLLEMAADGLEDRVAVGSRHDGITYRRLFERAGEAAARFRAAPGDRVVLCDESSPAVPVALFGADFLGQMAAPQFTRQPALLPIAQEDIRWHCAAEFHQRAIERGVAGANAIKLLEPAEDIGVMSLALGKIVVPEGLAA